MAEERTGYATFKGNPLTLLGPELQVGDQAPDFKVTDDLFDYMKEITLADYKGKVKLISVVPSLDTGICDAQTRRFNEEAAKLGENVVILTISVDLPTAQTKWCGAAGVDKVVLLSDYKHTSFGLAYGVLIKEMRLLHRSIFILDENDVVQYVEYVKEFASHVAYENALEALKKIV